MKSMTPIDWPDKSKNDMVSYVVVIFCCCYTCNREVCRNIFIVENQFLQEARVRLPDKTEERRRRNREKRNCIYFKHTEHEQCLIDTYMVCVSRNAGKMENWTSHLHLLLVCLFIFIDFIQVSHKKKKTTLNKMVRIWFLHVNSMIFN